MIFYCANCGCEIHSEVYMVRDNFLIVKYFDDNKSNRFCSKECACEALMIESVEREELPLDDGEKQGEEAGDDEYTVEDDNG